MLAVALWKFQPTATAKQLVDLQKKSTFLLSLVLVESFKEKVRTHVAGTRTMLLFGPRSFGVNLDFPYSVILSHVACNGCIFEHTIFKVKIQTQYIQAPLHLSAGNNGTHVSST